MDREDLAQAQQELEQARNQASPEHTTSAAKEFDPGGLEGTTLENAPDLGQAFDESKGSIQQETESGIGSQQVSEEAPDPEPRPNPELAEAADRESHETKMDLDNENARLANYEAMADRMEQQNQQDQGYDLDR